LLDTKLKTSAKMIYYWWWWKRFWSREV